MSHFTDFTGYVLFIITSFLAGVESADQCLLNSKVLSCFSGVIMSIRSFFLLRMETTTALFVSWIIMQIADYADWCRDIPQETIGVKYNNGEKLVSTFQRKLHSIMAEWIAATGSFLITIQTSEP